MALLTVSVLLSLLLFWLGIRAGSQLRQLQPEAQQMTVHRQLLSALLTDLMEYSKSNPGIVPVIESTGLIKTNASAPPAQAKPAGK